MMPLRVSLVKSAETRGFSSYPSIPLSSPSAADFRRAFTFSAVVSWFSSNTQSVREALRRGTRTARPLSLPLSSG